ncbi:murein DD-endopeptidase MepM/ murein hydrolase activator NlpD [Lewinella aquimaris]|uniref:Murein DD-endopeptidase MepM/ murein hydrolase activator NlpD n=1 Tax=Neolewinella aquimaris TaxID=1835722 RepID=A0A840E8Y6_9BACT|nr:M23 family metallopeptidase [Neolewinella aquimaris]MBB4079787.1 murein DD-endopeptidase MepM/ murein hydrolase activator NlpD [Neolewinella aquimaris]
MSRRSSTLTPLLLLAGFLVVIGACNRFFGGVTDAVENILTPRTPREAFAHDSLEIDLPGEPLVTGWDTAYRRALTDTLTVDLPYRERLRYPAAVELSAISVRFYLPPGRRLTVAARPDSLGGPVFGELFAVGEDDAPEPRDALLRWKADAPQFSFETTARGGQQLLLVVQAAPGERGTYELTLRSDPVLTFPVAGASTRNIKSFWGDSRSGGRRTHQGNDIFAPRGTPLLAVADGRVSSTKVGGLGGKTVWLRDGEGRGLTYYYAHLDSQLVRTGQSVRRGDTVGLVGNTGNARTTPPHLHFGIYRNGARDPYSYLTGPDEAAGTVSYPLTEAPDAVPERGKHYLRRSPERDRSVVVRELRNTEPVTVLGATDRYYRIRTLAGETGFANFD